MREPEEIEDRGAEVAVARVAAVDVAKASGVVCTRVPREGAPGRFVTRVHAVDATTNAILELADHLTDLQIEKIVLESTSDYWRPFFYLLAAAGLRAELVNARDVKNAPGRPKTDKLVRCGWPSWPGGACCGPRSCRRPRSGHCGITPGYAAT
jgi:transposase